MGLGSKDCSKTEVSGARTVRSLLKATSKFLLHRKIDTTFVLKKKKVYLLVLLKGITTLNAPSLNYDRKFSSCNLSWREHCIILQFKSSADSEINPVCRPHREAVLKQPLLAVPSA